MNNNAEQKVAHVHNSQRNQKNLYTVQTNTAIQYGHSELLHEENQKLNLRKKSSVYY